MAKTKKRSAVKTKGKSIKAENPFELKINRQKHPVLGRKLTKYDKGKPGLSRSRAIEKRKKTLLVEYANLGKNNTFLDRRIGENDPSLSAEQKKLRRHAKARKFNLDDSEEEEGEEEELTHFGQSLSEIEKFQDAIVSDDEDEDDDGRISAKIVGAEHFSGGILSRKEDETENGKTKSYKERMEELFKKSRLAKLEKQTEKQELEAQRERLDTEMKDIMSQIRQHHEGAKDRFIKEEEERGKTSSMSILRRTLMFEKRGMPSDRLKTEEELAKEEKEKLEKLENERLRRMNGPLKGSAGRSADALEDDDDDVGFNLDLKETEMDSEKGDNEDENSGAGDDDDDDSEAGSNDDEEDDDMSDLKDDDDDDEAKIEDIDAADDDDDAMADNKLSHYEVSSPAMNEEVPFVFKVPSSYDELKTIFSRYNQPILIIDRMRKCCHKALAEENQQKLETLFEYLLSYFFDLTSSDPPLLGLVDQLTEHLFELACQSPAHSAKTVCSHLQRIIKQKSSQNRFPGLDTLLFLKLIGALFPASDLHHPVITPSMLLMSRILTQSVVESSRDVVSGLFLSTLFLEFVSLSKRFVPEAINFLSGILFLTADKPTSRAELVSLPFRSNGANNPMKIKNLNSLKVSLPLKFSDIYSSCNSQSVESDELRINCLAVCLELSTKFFDLYKTLPAVNTLFYPIRHFAGLLNVETYPQEIQTLHSQMMRAFNETVDSYRYLVQAYKKPQPLKQFEPQVDAKFDGRKKLGGTREWREKQIEKHKYKKMKKGAEREIRKDQKFLRVEIMKEVVASKKEREKKVKDIMSSLAIQEGEVKALKRKKT